MESEVENSKIQETLKLDTDKLEYHTYAGEEHLKIIMDMIKQELSEYELYKIHPSPSPSFNPSSFSLHFP